MSDSSLLEKCCLIGEAVGGDPTHFMIERAFAELGLDWRFMSFETTPERLAEAVAGADALGFRGVRLRGAFRDRGAAASTQTDRAQRTGRVSHLTRHEGLLLGDDTSGPALVEALAPWGDPNGKRVVVLGAGGAGPSVADVLVERGAAAVAIADPSADKAAALVLSLKERADSQGPPEGAPPTEASTLAWEENWIETPDRFDWVIATASWPKEDNQRVAAALAPELSEGQLVVDLGVGSSRAPLLLVAEENGATVLDGLPVLVSETALAIEAWCGMRVDRDLLRDAGEEFLGV